MVVPIDFSGGDYSFLLEYPVVSSNVDVNGELLTVPSDYTDLYLATFELNGVQEDVFAQYRGLDISSSISYDGDDNLTPGEFFELHLRIENLYAVSNVLDIVIETDLGIGHEDTDRLKSLDLDRYNYRINIADNVETDWYEVTYRVTDIYGVTYSGVHEVEVVREEKMLITEATYAPCTKYVSYTVENYGTGDVVDAFVRIEQDDALLDYEFINLGPGTGYAQHSSDIFADVTDNFHVRLYDPQGNLEDYVPINFVACDDVGSVVSIEDPVMKPVVSQTVIEPLSTNHVSSEYWDLSETEVAAYLVLAMVAMIAVWTLMFLIKYLLT